MKVNIKLKIVSLFGLSDLLRSFLRLFLQLSVVFWYRQGEIVFTVKFTTARRPILFIFHPTYALPSIFISPPKSPCFLSAMESIKAFFGMSSGLANRPQSAITWSSRYLTCSSSTIPIFKIVKYGRRPVKNLVWIKLQQIRRLALSSQSVSTSGNASRLDKLGAIGSC